MIGRALWLAGLSLGLISVVAPAFAEVTCPQERAIYLHEETGFSISFRPLKSWEQTGMTIAIFDVELKDGRTLWGVIRTNMGTSRDVGTIYEGCALPGPEDGPSDEQLAECRVWEGVVYALEGNQASGVPVEAETAPQSLLFSDLGRQLRYTIFESPGDEPWDQLTLAACAPG